MDGEERYARDGEFRVGPILEEARLGRGLSLEEVEQATKIRKRYLLGLEQEDYSALPDAVYVHGFLKTYANYLGLDGEDLGRKFKDSRRPRRDRQINYEPPQTGFERPVIHPGGLSGAERRRFPVAAVLTVLIAVLILAGVLGFLYWLGARQTGDAPPGDAPPEGAPAGEPERASRETPEEPPEEPAADGPDQDEPGEDPAESAAGLEVVVRVEGRPSWLRVQADGVVVYEAVAEPGFAQVFSGRDAVGVRSGDAGAVGVEVNGQDYGPLGGDGEVVDRDFTLMDGR